MTCWNLWTKGYVSFDRVDAADNNNDKTPMETRRSTQWTQTQEGTLLPTTTKQKRRQYADAKNFDGDAPNLRSKQRWWYTNNGNDYGTTTATMEIIGKILTYFLVLTFKKLTSNNEVLQYLIKVCLLLIISEHIVFENKTNEQIQYLWERKWPVLFFISSLQHIAIHHLSIAPFVRLK